MSKLNNISYWLKIKYDDGVVEDVYVSSSTMAIREVMQNLISAKEIKIKKEID